MHDTGYDHRKDMSIGTWEFLVIEYTDGTDRTDPLYINMNAERKDIRKWENYLSF